MADSKITALTALTAADPANDMIPIVDVSDTPPASGNTKRISINNLLACSPSATLASLNVTGSSIPANGLYLPTTNTLEFAANSLAQYRIAPLGVFSWYDGAGGTRMTLNATGLGVGVVPSAARFEVGGSDGTQFYIRSTGTAPARIRGFTNSVEAGLIGFLNGGGIYFDVNGERMRIDTSGNVGIGVTPSTWGGLGTGSGVLQMGNAGCSLLAGGVGFSGTNQFFISNNAYYNATGGSSFKYYRAGGGAAQYNQVGNSHIWSVSSNTPVADTAITFTQAMTLDASGNLLVGTPTAGAKITALAGAAGQAAIFQQPAQNFWCVLAHNQATSGDNSFVLFGTEASFTSRGSITYNRAAGQVSYNITSDYRLKEDVKPLTGALNRISSLKPSTYKFKETGFTCEGFIAHELAEVIPSAVTGEKDAVNEDGSIKAQGVDLSKVVPVLVAAIQELTARVQTLEAK